MDRRIPYRRRSPYARNPDERVCSRRGLWRGDGRRQISPHQVWVKGRGGAAGPSGRSTN